MKKIVFILLLMPIFGMTQTEMGEMSSFRKGYINADIRTINNAKSNNSNSQANPTHLMHSYSSNSDEYRMLLDSFYQVNFNSNSDTSTFIREYYKYDEKGNRILLTNINPCEGCAASTHKIETIYDENGNRTMELIYFWNFTSKQFNKVRKTDYTFDGKGKLTNIMEHMWLENGTEVNPAKTDLSYDEQGNVLLKVSTRYDANTNEWVGDVKDEYAYTNNKCTLYIFYRWNKETSQWVYLSKNETEYDANGNITLGINYNWENSKNQWIPSSKRTYIYSQEGKMTNYTNFQWDISTSQWFNNQKTDYFFDTNGRETEQVYSEWDNSASKWIGLNKYESNYNEKAFLTFTASSRWNKIMNTWDISSKEEYEYDSNGNNTSITSYYWNLSENAWSIRTKTNNYYSLHDLTNKVDIKEKLKVRLYPNPVSETFTLVITDNSATQCQLYNSNGQLLQTLPVEQGVNTYNVSHLREGMYLLKIKTVDEIIVKKIIKK